ncbi:glycoprotein 3-alpha-L-fucosyltransferase A-like [Leguminivora glycinivorella]|uniref:glycoprotein 3-alpha-L-fucosyltransferase A-like n=1 Tax=Leguminivora glycinivorella TaxID=1035111 RepID=UPI00200DFC7B|nr:glycoprotein 3-alpha-L-fucosyltransferase A-like [Leguminivora glycinivorella]XP_047995888.1 glycoprotein 3-alpha-L-fucosyltransferase A-like [Leguminivora glycinivorella]
MNDIIKDKDRYYNFFKWRNHYSYHHSDEAPDSDVLCRICEVLHDETLVAKKTVHREFRYWWSGPEACSPLASKVFKWFWDSLAARRGFAPI